MSDIIEPPQAIDLDDFFLCDHYSVENLFNFMQQNGLSLSQLRQRLQKHRQHLNQTSLDLFNDSYDRFYRLSYIIACLSEPIQHLVEPLKTFRDQLAQLCSNHDQYVAQIDSKLDSLRETSSNKELASRLIMLIKRRDRIHKQLQGVDWSFKLSDRNHETDNVKASANRIASDLLERTIFELHHLKNELNTLKPTNDELKSIKDMLNADLTTKQNQLDDWFERTFLEAIGCDDKSIIEYVLQTYKQIGCTYKINSCWQNKIAKPYISMMITDSNLSQDVTNKFNQLVQFLSAQSKLIGDTFVAELFWQEVVTALEKLDKIYSLDPLDTFQRRYNNLKSFLSVQNDLQTMSLRQTIIQENTERVMQRFKINIYLEHRVSLLKSRLESAIASQPLTELSDPSQDSESLIKLKLRITNELYTLVTNCWSPEIYLDALDTELTQLSCRLIGRFADWLNRLRLSDFRVTGTSNVPDSNSKRGNFLDKQNAIMRLLIDDCESLSTKILSFVANLNSTDAELVAARTDMVSNSLNNITNGLKNVRSLQKLIER